MYSELSCLFSLCALVKKKKRQGVRESSHIYTGGALEKKAHYCLERGRALGFSVNLSAKLCLVLSFAPHAYVYLYVGLSLYLCIFYRRQEGNTRMCVHLQI